MIVGVLATVAGVLATLYVGGVFNPHPTPTPTPTRTPTGATHHGTLYLAQMNPTSTDLGESGTTPQTGLARASGQTFTQSVEQLYDTSCCGDAQTLTYSIPAGYTRFQATVGMDNSAGYDRINSPTVTFILLENSTDVLAKQQTMLDGAPQNLSVAINTPTTLTLKTTTDTTPCAVCSAGAVWGHAELVPAKHTSS
jgi:hypothetical protein